MFCFDRDHLTILLVKRGALDFQAKRLLWGNADFLDSGLVKDKGWGIICIRTGRSYD
jgi:hypothetical protein